VGERYRQSYLHDVRGGLQALNSAVELLIRAASAPGENAALAEKASALARRAVQRQEKSLVDLVNQLTLQSEMATTLNVGEMVDDVMRFIRNDSASKSITFRAESAADVFVLAQAHKFRMLILGLSLALTDGLAPGTVVDVAVARAGSSASVEFRSVMPCSSVPTPENLSQADNSSTSLFELIVALTGRWTALNGGRIDLSTEPHLPTALRIYYPLASSEQGSHDHGTGAIDTAVEGSLHRG
jgi:hypothetical protein